MLARLHVEYVIVGHSERRRLFGETDETVAAKVKAVVRNGMTPICCVGEDLDEREAGMTKDLLAGQVEAALRGLPSETVGTMVIAYEPLWAIGTGQAATAEDAQEACQWIREVVGRSAGAERCGRSPPAVRGIGRPRRTRRPWSGARISTESWWEGPASIRRPSWGSSGPRPGRFVEFASVLHRSLAKGG